MSDGGDLAGAVAIVTGAAGGLGRAIAEGLVGTGAMVVAISVSKSSSLVSSSDLKKIRPALLTSTSRRP